jgi:hypothetical protein
VKGRWQSESRDGRFDHRHRPRLQKGGKIAIIMYSFIQCCGSGSESGSVGSVCFLGLLDSNPDPLVRGMDPFSDHQGKIVRKTLIPTVL